MNKFVLKTIESYTQDEKNAFFQKMHSEMQDYVDYCNSDDFSDDDNYSHAMYENVCIRLAPNFFEWFNKKMTEDNDDR